MAERLCGPDEAYTVRFLAYKPLAEGSANCCRQESDRGEPLPLQVLEGPDGPDAPRPEYLVHLPGTATLRLRACADALTITDLRVEAPGAVSLLARVSAGPGAPEWLPPVADYAVFHGTRREVPRHLHIRFRPDRRRPAGAVSVDRLVTALGRSITSANNRLARLKGAGGVALASSVTVRVAVDRFAVSGSERVLLRLAQAPVTGQGQQVEITLTTVPAEGAEDDA